MQYFTKYILYILYVLYSVVGFSRFAPVRANRFLDSHTVCEPVTKILENESTMKIKWLFGIM